MTLHVIKLCALLLLEMPRNDTVCVLKGVGGGCFMADITMTSLSGQCQECFVEYDVNERLLIWDQYRSVLRNLDSLDLPQYCVWQGHKILDISVYTGWSPARQILGCNSNYSVIWFELYPHESCTDLAHFNHSCSPVIIRNVYIDIWFVSLSDVTDQIDEEWFMKWGGAVSLTHLCWHGLIGWLSKFVLATYFKSHTARRQLTQLTKVSLWVCAPENV